MSNTRTVRGTYGSGYTPCNVIISDDRHGCGCWYAVEDSANVNFTYEDVQDGVNVEALRDDDHFTYPAGIDSEEKLAEILD